MDQWYRWFVLRIPIELSSWPEILVSGLVVEYLRPMLRGAQSLQLALMEILDGVGAAANGDGDADADEDADAEEEEEEAAPPASDTIEAGWLVERGRWYESRCSAARAATGCRRGSRG